MLGCGSGTVEATDHPQYTAWTRPPVLKELEGVGKEVRYMNISLVVIFTLACLLINVTHPLCLH